jgi:hypothetical protein
MSLNELSKLPAQVIDLLRRIHSGEHNSERACESLDDMLERWADADRIPSMTDAEVHAYLSRPLKFPKREPWLTWCLEHNPPLVKSENGVHWLTDFGLIALEIADAAMPADRVPPATDAEGLVAREAKLMPSAARESAGSSDSEGLHPPPAYPVHIESVSDEVAQLLGARKPPESASIPPEWSGTAWDDLTPLLKRLLNYMYDRERVNITDLEIEVWGKDISDAALQTALSKANNFLLTIRHPRTLEKVRGEPVVRWQ